RSIRLGIHVKVNSAIIADSDRSGVRFCWHPTHELAEEVYFNGTSAVVYHAATEVNAPCGQLFRGCARHITILNHFIELVIHVYECRELLHCIAYIDCLALCVGRG